MTDDQRLVELVQGFLNEDLALADSESRFLRAYKDADIVDSPLKRPLARAFIAVEAYDPSRTPKTETVHNSSYQTLMSELRAAADEINRLGAPSD